jgi:hypothetical protein
VTTNRPRLCAAPAAAATTTSDSEGPTSAGGGSGGRTGGIKAVQLTAVAAAVTSGVPDGDEPCEDERSRLASAAVLVFATVVAGAVSSAPV